MIQYFQFVHFSFNVNCGHRLILLYECFCTGIESIDIPRILSQQGGDAVYPLPKIKALEVHPKLNLAALLFAVKHNHLYGSNWILISEA